MRRSVAEMIVRDPEKYAHHDRVFLNNPVVMQGMGLAPLVVLATTGKNALMLAVSVALLLTPSRMLACLLSRAFPLRDEQPAKEELEKKLLPRGLIYSGSAAVVYLAVYPILNALFGVDLLALGIYLPMLVVEPMLIYRFGRVQETMQKAVSKGLRITLDALKKLKDAGHPFRMVFVGSGGDKDEVVAYANELGLADRVFFTSPKYDRNVIRAWYCRADLFLFPSSYDTNGLVVREAAACDLAAVLIDGSCAAEGVTDGVDGFLIDENAGSMAAKLQEICKHPECMAQVGRQAGDRLYLSWGDAVKRARERYGIVMENYRMGRYDDHHRPMDGVLNAQGNMMEALAKLLDLGDGLAERYREGWNEHREGIQERRDEFREEFQERLEEHREGRRAFRTELKQKGEALWQKLDRYL